MSNESTTRPEIDVEHFKSVLAAIKKDLKRLAEEQRADKKIIHMNHEDINKKYQEWVGKLSQDRPANLMRAWANIWDRKMHITCLLNLYLRLRGKTYRHSEKKFVERYGPAENREYINAKRDLAKKYFVKGVSEGILEETPIKR